MASICSRFLFRSSSVTFLTESPSKRPSLRSMIISGAPFTYATSSPSGVRWMVVIRLRAESKGSSATRG